MKSTEFKAWMKSIEHMSRNQRDKLRKRLEGKEHADEVIALIEWSSDDKVACPDCKATELYRWGKVSELQNAIVVANANARLMRLRARHWHDYATRTNGSNMSTR